MQLSSGRDVSAGAAGGGNLRDLRGLDPGLQGVPIVTPESPGWDLDPP